MNWKKLLSAFLLYPTVIFASLSLLHRTSWGLHSSYYVCILDAFVAIALSLGIVGNQELERGGHWKVIGILTPCIFLAPVIVFVATLWGGVSLNWFCPAFSLFAVPFPLALYLNRRQNKSTSQPTSANVS
jgi:hypothetical protein